MTRISQNRDAPAFQEYAASMMGRFEFRRLNLEERGLLWTLRLECWVNQNIPSDPTELAEILGLQSSTISRILPRLMVGFFEAQEGFIRAPDLEDYRKAVNDRRNRQSDGGKKARRNDSQARVRNKASNLDSTKMNLLSEDQMSSDKEKEVYREGDKHKGWIEDYERGDPL